jgi:hypothetical protein
VSKLFCTIEYGYPSALADELIMCGFVNVLKPAPAAHVIDKNDTVLRLVDDITKQLSEAGAVSQPQSALSGVLIGLGDDEAMLFGVLLNGSRLVDQGVVLVLRGHAEILGC